jgi:two-component system response regulator
MLPKKTILLIEDNPDDEALALRAFQKNGITNPVMVARDGLQALDYLFPQSDKDGDNANSRATPLPGVVLLDLKLPRIDGLEVLRRIRADERTALLPVVILTTSNEPLDIQQSYHLGANSFIRKPVDYQDFVQTVATLAHYWLSLNVAATPSAQEA